ncbi:HNH endonuclease [Pedobacter sp. HMWF019]|uniref:HNH endonuclease n=1 Tax=Pedobacter sp. HMWF019 TaxID=2056856 RepID=UPI000D3594B0|nr:HNH endonuclease [Pedobacter sp. HMWF019]PTS92727.1 HNH endonuclease [Pedobacter sp. HMWF019]
MNRIILQPAANKPSQKNYLNTIINSIKINQIIKYITSEQEATLRELYPTGEFKIWGIDYGDQKVKDWNRITRGDIALFAKNKFVYSSATVTTKFQNRELAIFLWGYKTADITWEYLYFLDELRPRKISYEDLNSLIPKGKPGDNKFYEPNKNIQGFQVLSDFQSSCVFVAFDELESKTYFDNTNAGNFEATQNKLRKIENTDQIRPVKVRAEQQTLSEHLFGDKIFSTCGICNKQFPVGFLHAAHIKKRAECSHEDRIDPNIVMPMCRMGCDDLYERGYISIKDGKVIGLRQEHTTPAIEKAKDAVIGNDCTHYNDQTMKYFEWHFDFHSGNKP